VIQTDIEQKVPIYRLNPQYIHYGLHTWSGRFTDDLVNLLGKPPRLVTEPITGWHEDLAYSVQYILEETVCELVRWGMQKTNNTNLCVGGGVGLNVKLNSSLFNLKEVESIFAHPLCNDSGAAAGAALAACWELTGAKPKRLNSLALGNEYADDEIEKILDQCQVEYSKQEDIADVTAQLLANGKIVGWFQGRMEAGPRALGNRSILANPRDGFVKERINNIIKYREVWRPYCPSIIADEACKYLEKYDKSPFMNIAFYANEQMKQQAPAIVHVDGTTRIQMVFEEDNPLFYRLLSLFRQKTELPILLNTSFNIKGEPIVCTVYDALRTYFGTGLDALACGPYLLKKK
jgi:carbamoyltransferase